MEAVLDMNDYKITNLAEPTSGSDAARLTDVLAVAPGTGINTFLVTPTSANLAAALTDETGTGLAVFNTSPTLVTPDLGTPTAAVLTNATGLPVAGIASSTSTALGVGSLELGHATDTTLARSSAGNMTIEGNLIYRAGGADVPITDGGTGSSTAADARTALAVVGTAALTASSGSAMVGFLQAGTGAVTTTAQAKLRLTKAAEDFGAVGDGTTENVTLIQAGLDALSAAGGGILTFGAGTFKVTGNLLLASNVGICGAGRTATIINISGSIRPSNITFGGTRTYRQSVKSLSIVNTTGGAGSVALNLSNISLAEVDEVELSGAETCLYMAGYAFYNSIKSVRATTNGQGTGQFGFKIRGGVRNLFLESVTHNGDAGQTGLDIASDVNSGVNDITVVNGRFENGDAAAGTAYTGVKLHGYSAGNNLQAVRLYGGGVDAALLTGSKAVVQTGYVSSCSWDGNPFWSLPSGSTYFDLSDTSSFQVGSTDFQSYYGGAFRIRLANTAGTFGQVPSYSAQIYADTSAGNHRIFFRNQVDTGWSDLYAGKIVAATALEAGTTLTTGGNATIGGAVNATDEVTTTVGYYKSGLLVVGPRKTGWSTDTGTAKRTANATYSGTAGATYDQTVMQTLMDAVREYTQTMKALKDDIHATTGNHGLIGT